MLRSNKRKPIFQFILRTIIALILVGAIYAIAVPLPRYLEDRRNKPSKDIALIRENLIGNLAALSSLESFPEQGATSIDGLNGVQRTLDETHKALDKLVEQPPDTLDPQIKGQLEQLLRDHHGLMDMYSFRLQQFSKPIEYNPVSDLGELDVTKDKEELLLRASAASGALQRIADTQIFSPSQQQGNGGIAVDGNDGSFSLSDDGRKSFASSAACLREFGDLLQKNSFDEAKSKRTRCLELYPSTRKHAITTVTDVVRTKMAQVIRERQQSLIERLEQ